MQIKLLSIIIPIYKKEKTILKELIKLYSTLKTTPYKFEIIGVVDGTNLDNSLVEARKLKKPEVKIYGYKNNKGKGQAVRYGMQIAKGDVVTFIDSGGDVKPQSLVMLLEHMKWYNADIIIGSKLHSASIVKNYSGFRRVLTYGYYLIVKLLFHLKVRDTQTGLKAYKKYVLENVLDKLVIKQFVFDIEVLAVAYKLGYKRIYDAPVFVDFGKSTSTMFGLSLGKTIALFLIDTIGVWYRMNILRYYDKGRKKVKIFDTDINMWVNTGEMTDKHQIVINFVNSVFSRLGRILHFK
ncbi:hypothetical protein COV24_02090 [candidate division WWE3 bacterium CG10_big_fil_rev_8_21_14_0_10_32_10]|uniref:Glycosyltransferase 2-like domain-containing protein n=1 Tax=candidate division WWE3 bacterium CG10_big_fil_rev_8_21_14_0_10_32_10 TaxID=1975090 RepID=A0A2H0RAN5_UNCKA|nr:MAG: hypothetical protein COV24_02090 [candidate division WWE3 bacterium CG10_big_fil_rev_8_21_14_0_10_32_10]